MYFIKINFVTDENLPKPLFELTEKKKWTFKGGNDDSHKVVIMNYYNFSRGH